MAGKYGAQSTWGPYVDGYNLQSAKNKTMPMKVRSTLEKTTGLGDSFEESNPVGLIGVDLSLTGGFYDTNTAASHAALSASVSTNPQGAARIMCWGYSGQVLGEPFYGAQGTYEEAYTVQSAVGELTKANADWKISGQLDRGQIVHVLAARTTDGNSEAGSVDYVSDVQQQVIPITSASKAVTCVVTTTVPHGKVTGQKVFISSNTLAGPAINGEQTITVTGLSTFTVAVDTSGSTGAGTGGSFVAADSNGGAATYLQITAYSGLTNIIVKTRDSADNITFADLTTHATMTATGADRQTVAGTVDRYLAVDWNVTGTGSATFFAGVARS